MEKMHRTQIYLEADLNERLDRLARKRRVSKASLIRLAARRFVEQERVGDEDPILGIIGLGHGGPGCASVEHDRILVEQSLNSRSK